MKGDPKQKVWMQSVFPNPHPGQGLWETVLLLQNLLERGCCQGSSKEALPGPGGCDWMFASSSPVKAMPLAQE